jgi:hypothetical protein
MNDPPPAESYSPLPWGEGDPLPALSSAGAGRVRGHLARGKTQHNSNGKWQKSNGKWFLNLNEWQIANHLNFAFCGLRPFLRTAKSGTDPSPVRRWLKRTPSPDTLSLGERAVHRFRESRDI